MVDFEERRGGVPSGYPHHVGDFSLPHIFTVIPTACGATSQPRHGRGSRPWGAIVRDSKGSTTVVRSRVRYLVEVSKDPNHEIL